MERGRNNQAASLFFWIVISGLLSQNLVIPVMSESLKDQKNYYSPDPHARSPPGGSHGSPPHHTTPSHGTPPSHRTPSHGGGSHNPTPSTPSPGGSGNCGIPPYSPTPTTPTPTPSGGGYYNPPTSGGGSPPTPVYTSPPTGGSPPTPVYPSPPTGGSPPTPVYPSPPTGGSPPTPVYTSPPTGGSPPTPVYTSPPTIPIDPGTPSYPGTCNYWRTHPTVIWGLLGWWGTLGSAFGTTSVPGFGTNMSLQQALSNTRTDGLGALFREGTASWLNSMVNNRFPFTTRQVRESFVAALGSNNAAASQAQLFKMANEGRLKPRA